MIEDDELRSIFKIESAEHILGLEEGLLHIEKDLDNRELLEAVFRDVHSLKGAAHMLGLKSLETISHDMEDILSAAREGSVPLSPVIIENLYKGLDLLTVLVKDSVSDEPAGAVIVNASENISNISITTIPGHSGPECEETRSSHLSADNFKSMHAESAVKKPENAEDNSDIKTPGDSLSSQETSESPAGKFHIETIRVEPKRLDKLMSQTGELTVTKLRIIQRLEDINDIIVMWDKISRNLSVSDMKNGTVIKNFGLLLNKVRNGLHDQCSRLDQITSELNESISRIRLLPVSTIFNFFKRMVRDLAKEKQKDIRLSIAGGDTAVDKRIIEEIKDPLMHIIRNAVDHGIEMPEERKRKKKNRTGTITLKAYQTPSNVVIEVIDDGRGLDIDAIKSAALKMKIINENELHTISHLHANSLIFTSGVSTSGFVSDISGRGVGLDVARANVERLKGTIQIESTYGSGCTFRIQLPLTLSASKVMIISDDNIKYAIPVEYIQTACFINQQNIFTIHGRRTISYKNRPVPIAVLSDLLELKRVNLSNKDKITVTEKIPCVVISTGDEKLGLLVNELIDEQEVVLKPHGSILKRVRNISGSTILGTGEICLILNPYDLIKTAGKAETIVIEKKIPENTESVKKILIAEDSITVRTQMKRILKGAGYEVAVAVDGLEAYTMLCETHFDAVVSDIQMPNMTGIELTEKIRKNKKYSEIPVILITSLTSDSDRKQGVEAGANAYITKPSFDQKVLLDTLRRLV
jgi:two-component system chemotaxis sensor kinase CheA